jgi:hypothetical protein
MFLPKASRAFISALAANGDGQADSNVDASLMITADETGKLMVFENKKRIRRHAVAARSYLSRGSSRMSPSMSIGGNMSPRGSDRSPRGSPRESGRGSGREIPQFEVTGTAKLNAAEKRTKKRSSLGPILAFQQQLEDESSDSSL